MAKKTAFNKLRKRVPVAVAGANQKLRVFRIVFSPVTRYFMKFEFMLGSPMSDEFDANQNSWWASQQSDKKGANVLFQRVVAVDASWRWHSWLLIAVHKSLRRGCSARTDTSEWRPVAAWGDCRQPRVFSNGRITRSTADSAASISADVVERPSENRTAQRACCGLSP